MSRAGWLFIVALAPILAFAQGEEPRVIVVPVPSEAAPDAGAPVAQPPPPPPAPPPEPVVNTPPPPTPPPADKPVAAQPVEQTPPAPLVPEDTGPQNPDAVSTGPSAMLDGHPREGSFLSGPGSFFFVMHHTLMGTLGVLATQMVPRAIRGLRVDLAPYDAFGGDARIAYLVGALVGAGVGFASSATWQFFTWMNYSTVSFGLINSVIGALFGIGMTNLFTQDATPISWMGLVGALSGAWLTAIIGGGDMAFNKGVLITSGAAWAAIYAALILGIIASTGASPDIRPGIDAVMFMPAVGGAALAIASLKFNPSAAQVFRADIFGGGVGLAVLLLSAALVPKQFNNPIPYALAGVTAAGAKIIVSLLWVDTIAPPPAPATPEGTKGPATIGLSTMYRDPENHRPYSRVWW